MTRELKLALIVGFSLVLVVAILIADHLSSARRVKLADGAAQNTAIAPVGGQPEPLPAAFGNVQPGPLATPVSPATVAPQLPDAATPAPVVIAETTPVVTEPVPELRQGSGAAGSPAASGDTALLEKFREVGHRVIGNNIEPPPTVARLDRVELTPVGPATLANPVPPPMTVHPLIPPPAPQALRTHKVAPGESVYKLAQRYYGDGKLWRKIANANPKLGKDAVVREGMILTIPADAPNFGLAAANGKAAPGSPKAQAAKAADGKTYTVQKGDTLGVIAQKTLGTVKRTKDILAMNTSIKDPDRLTVNAVLYIPAN